MEKSERFGFNLPSRDGDDIADINQISENFRIIDNKMVEGVAGKGLSTNDFTNKEKEAVALIDTKANLEYKELPTDIFSAVEIGIEGKGTYILNEFYPIMQVDGGTTYSFVFGNSDIRLVHGNPVVSTEYFENLGFIIGKKYEIEMSLDTGGSPTVIDSIKAVIDVEDKVDKTAIDQTYSPESPNAQSGIAVAEATNFKLLCSTEVTQEAFDEANGEIKVISVGNENKTFDGVNQIRILIYLPISDTINTANSRLAIRATANAGDSLAPDDTILLRGTGAGESVTLLYNKSQYLSATLDFIGNKFVQGICVKNLYGSYTYGTSAYGWTHSPINMGDKKYLHIRSHDKTFKFPVGTTVEVYGR